jgi:hypothetical protein
VPPPVREYFQHEIERIKKATLEWNQERLRKEAVAAEGNYPNAEDEEEAQLQRAIHLSRAEELYRRGWNREVVHMSVDGVFWYTKYVHYTLVWICLWN